MTVSPTPPVAPAASSTWKRVTAKITAAVLFARSAEGRKDLGALVAVATALYTALHRAGV